MIRFNQYYEEFILYVKKKEGCPEIKESVFIFAYRGVDESKYEELGIEDAEKIFNGLLDQGCSWINLACSKIVRGKLFVTFEMSNSYDPFFIGKTRIAFVGPNIDNSGKFIWDPVVSTN